MNQELDKKSVDKDVNLHIWQRDGVCHLKKLQQVWLYKSFQLNVLHFCLNFKGLNCEMWARTSQEES